MKLKLLLSLLLIINSAIAQENSALSVRVHTMQGEPIPGATVEVRPIGLNALSDRNGRTVFSSIPGGGYTLHVRCLGFLPGQQAVHIVSGQDQVITVECEENPMQLEQVVVTAEKRENELQRVPMAISAIQGRQVEQRRIREMGDLVLSVPNMISMNAGAPTLNMISLRGILTFSTDPVIGMYIDGIPMYDGYSASMQLQDIERIEVLRGPQSTLYGRNGLGGVINIITRAPTNTPRGYLEAGLGNYGQQQYSLGLSGPLVKDKLFAGFSGLYDTREGFFKNQFDGEKYDLPKTYNGNFYLKYRSGDRLSFTLNAKAEYNDIKGAFPYVVGAESAFSNPFTINQNEPNLEERKLYNASLKVAYRLGGMEISSVTGYSYLSDIYKRYDYDYSPHDIALFEMPRQPQNTFTQEFKVVTDASKALRFTGGLFGFADRKEAEMVIGYGPEMPPSEGSPAPPYRTVTYSDKKNRGIAAFANLTYALSSRWEATVGLRYDYEKRNLRHHTDLQNDPDPVVNISPPTKIYGSNSAFSPKVSLAYRPLENAMLYATYARGYRAGGFNNYAPTSEKLNYGPEHTDNYELGFKSQWLENRLRSNVTLFYTHWTDQQQTVLPENIIDNIGELTSKGLELELTAIVAKGLEARYNLGVVHARYDHLLMPDETGTTFDYAGNRQIFTPDFTTSLSLTYTYEFNPLLSLYVLPEWKYFGKQYMNFYNDLEQKPFNLISASAGLRYRWAELSLWAKNIGDARYLSFAYATQAADATPVLIGNPRTFGVSLKLKF